MATMVLPREEKLSQDEYLTLLMEADPAKHSIRKTRYCFTWEEQYFELDVYPTWSDQAILEVELKDEDEEIVVDDVAQYVVAQAKKEEFGVFSLDDISAVVDADLDFLEGVE